MEHSKPAKPQGRPGCLLLFGLFWMAFSAIFVFIGTGDGDTPFIIFGAVFVLIGLAIFLFGGLSFYSRWRIGKPEITISELRVSPFSRTIPVTEPFSVVILVTFDL